MAKTISRGYTKWVIGVLCFSLLFGIVGVISPTAHAAARSLSVAQNRAHASPASSACWTSPSYSNCDGYDPIVTGCNQGAYVLGGDPWYLGVYWSASGGHCLSNYAYVQGPYFTYNGQQYQFWLQEVTVTRRNSPVPMELDYCTHFVRECSPTAWMSYTHTWETDMLYGYGSNGENQIQVCIYYSQGIRYTGITGFACSIWH